MRRTILIILAIPLVLTAQTDGVEMAWVQHYGSGLVPSVDGAIDIAVDAEGCTYVTGVSYESDSYGDYATIKYNADGTEAWIVRYDGPGHSHDRPADLYVDSTHNVYVTGGSYRLEGGSNYATIKYNPDGSLAWTAQYNGPGNDDDVAKALTVDALGNVYVTGKSYGTSGNTDFLTIKYNPDGIEVWTAAHNGLGNGDDVANALAVDTVGNVYVTGNSVGLDGDTDYATIKYNSDGTEAWTVQYIGPAGYDRAVALVLDIEGNIFVTGVSQGGTGSAGDRDGVTLKYRPDGSESWVARSNLAFYHDPTALAVDAVGNVYVTGISDADIATIKYNSDGSEAWVSLYEYAYRHFEKAWAVAVDAVGNVYVAGTILNDGYGSEDYGTTIKYYPDGTIAWAVQYDMLADNNAYATALAVDPTGNVYVTGWSEGVEGNSDFATVKYSSAGAEIWTARYNGSGNSYDRAYDMVVDNSGNVYVTGESNTSPDYFDYATAKYSSDGTEVWVVRHDGLGFQMPDQGNTMGVDGAGNLYVTGAIDGENGSDYVTIKYSPNGTEMWEARYNGSGDSTDVPKALSVDEQGNIYVSGSSYGADGNRNTTTIKYNSDGSEAWVASHDGLDGTITQVIDAAGDLYVTGNFITVKYNPDGTEAWVATYDFLSGHMGHGEVVAIAVNDIGSVFITGNMWEGIDWQCCSADSFATIKYNPDGSEAWVTIGDGGAITMVINEVDNVYVAVIDFPEGLEEYSTIKYNSDGSFAWIGQGAQVLAADGIGNIYGTQGGLYGMSDSLTTFKFNPDGSEAWRINYVGPVGDDFSPTTLALDASGSVYVTGSSVSSNPLENDWLEVQVRSVYTTIKYLQPNYPVSVENTIIRGCPDFCVNDFFSIIVNHSVFKQD